jgi:two-component system, sensor histidine kinase and response regulator
MNEDSINILVVDDNQENLRVVSTFLKEKGYKIALALNGTSALKVLGENKIDLILLDVMMPEMDGFEVCKKIKQIKQLREIPIIFLTARNQTEDLVEGFSIGGVDYINKPFNREELFIRVKTHLDLGLSKKKILEMNQTRDKLYSIIAHDIRSPLASISGFINALSNKLLNPDSEDFKRIISNLENTTTHTINLLENLLHWTKLQNNNISVNPRLIRIYDIIDDCIGLLKANADSKKVSLLNYSSHYIEIYADESTMTTVFRNLISNAIKFTREGGTITIGTKKEEDNVVISISDTGIGMPSEIIDKIFVKNEQYTTQGTSNEKGSGLGLYLVKDFVERNNGKIAVTSNIGVGTEINVYLPSQKRE